MKKRIFGNWKTTAIGLTALTAGTIGLLMGKVTGSEYGGIVTFSATYLVAKDSLLEGLTGGAVKVEGK